MNIAVTTLTAQQKALEINLDPNSYGSFAEIGAGQEVASIFFKSGAASGTIAKTISAYDMTISDTIYGAEESGRYVCEPRLMKMLNREYSLLEQRLKNKRHPETLFFAFANTVVTLNYNKTNEGHGWMGIRFQLSPDSEPNDVIIHVRMLDTDTLQQQHAVGVIGVNLIYACFYYHQVPEQLINSLLDNLGRERIEVDMVRITGPSFKNLDNRLIALMLVKNHLTEAAVFDPKGNVLQPSEIFYKKNLLMLRSRFRPCTHVNIDMLRTGLEQFKNNKGADETNILTISELTLTNLESNGEINEKDFLDRAEILCSLGQTVMISNYHEYYRLVAYLSRFTKNKIGIILGMPSFSEIFEEKYYAKLKGGILESFSILFSKNVKLYVYPSKDSVTGEIRTCENFTLPKNLIDLYEYLIVNDKIEDVRHAKLEYLDIYSDNILKMIQEGQTGWEKFVPELVAEAITNKQLFGYKLVC